MSCDNIHMMDCCLFILIATDNLSESVFEGRKLGLRREGSREAGQGNHPAAKGVLLGELPAWIPHPCVLETHPCSIEGEGGAGLGAE